MDLKDYKKEMSELNISNISDDNIYKICKGEMKGKTYKKVTHSLSGLRIAAAGIAFVVMSASTVFAAEHIIKYVSYNQTGRNEYKKHEYAQQYEDKSVKLGESSCDNNISISLDSVISGERGIYAVVTLTSQEGKALFASTKEEVPSVNGHIFEKAYLTDGTNRLDFNGLARTDDTQDKTKAVYELKYTGINNKKLSETFKTWDVNKIKLVLENLDYNIMVNKDIQFLPQNLKNAIEQSQKEAVQVSGGYSDIFITDSQYEGNTIDITYKYVNEESKNAILDFKLFNSKTGHNILPQAEQTPEDDRLVRKTIYKENDDGTITISYIPGKQDTTIDLTEYIITRADKTEKRSILGHWEMDADIKVESSIEYELSEGVKATLSSMDVEFDKVGVSDLGIVIEGRGYRFDEPQGNDLRDMKLLNNEGEVILYVDKKQITGQAGYIDRSDLSKGIKVKFEAYFDELINKEEVAYVVFGDTLIELKNID